MRSNREWPTHRSVRCQGCLKAQQFVLDVAHQDPPRCTAVPNNDDGDKDDGDGDGWRDGDGQRDNNTMATVAMGGATAHNW